MVLSIIGRVTTFVTVLLTCGSRVYISSPYNTAQLQNFILHTINAYLFQFTFGLLLFVHVAICGKLHEIKQYKEKSPLTKKTP